MEEMSPAVALPLGIGNPLLENQNPLEITCFKLMADTAATLLTDPMDKDVNKQSAESTEMPISVDSAKETEVRGGMASGSGSGSGSGVPSVYLRDYSPLWGSVSICGWRPEMEDAVVSVPRFFELPLWMVAGDRILDGSGSDSIRVPAHFFGVYDGHGGAQVADYCRDRMHLALVEELTRLRERLEGDDCQKQWERAFTDCFQRVDDEIGGKTSDFTDLPSEPVAPETVGSTAVVAVICSSHIIVANCGDSRAVLCRGKQPMALSVDHKIYASAK